jgi:flagellar secretion chaperone FliS
MFAELDNYSAYTDNMLVGASPMRLIVALYQGAVDAVGQAKRCYSVGDIMGRGVAITKASSILSELISSLDMEKGGEISANLKKLYGYMLGRILMAHAQQKLEPMTEVEGLLMQLLEAWKTVAAQPLPELAVSSVEAATFSESAVYTDIPKAAASSPAAPSLVEDYGELIIEAPEQEITYTGYFLEAAASTLGQAYSF